MAVPLLLVVFLWPSVTVRANSLPLPAHKPPLTAPAPPDTPDPQAPSTGSIGERDHPTWRLSAGLATYTVTTLLADDAILGHFFVLGDLQLVATLAQYWELGIAIRGGGAVAGDAPETALGALLDGRYIIDRMTWSPWISLGVGGLYRSRGTDVYLGQAGGDRLDFSVHAGLGLDYDPGDGWSGGAVIRYHLLLTDDLARVVGPIEFSLHATYTFP